MKNLEWTRAGVSVLTLVSFSIAGTAGALAQSTAGDDRPPVANAVTSPVDGRGFRISGSLRTVYDTNIRRLRDGAEPQPGGSKSDFRFTPQVSAAYGQPFGRQQLFINGDYGRDIYARNEQLNRDRYSIGGGLLWRLGRACSGSVTADFKRRQALLSDTEVQVDNTQKLEDYRASGDCAPPVGIGFGGSIARSTTQNDNIERQLQDSRTTSYDAHLNFGSPGLGNFSAGGVLTQIQYPNRSLFVDTGSGIGEVDDKLDIYSARLGYSRSVGPRLSINASVSYIKVEPDPKDVLSLVEVLPGVVVPFPNARESFSGPGYSLSINYKPSSRIGAVISGSRNVTSSNNVGARFTIRDAIYSEVTYALGPSISTAVGASFDRQRYRGSLPEVGLSDSRERDNISRVYARASYAPRPLYSIDFEIAHLRRKSDPAEFSSKSTSAAVTLRTTFGR